MAFSGRRLFVFGGTAGDCEGDRPGGEAEALGAAAGLLLCGDPMAGEGEKEDYAAPVLEVEDDDDDLYALWAQRGIPEWEKNQGVLVRFAGGETTKIVPRDLGKLIDAVGRENCLP